MGGVESALSSTIGAVVNPLMGIPLTIANTFLSGLSGGERDCGERVVLQSFNKAGCDCTQFRGIMPNQEDFIRRMQNLESQIEFEQGLTRKHQEDARKMRRELDEKIKKIKKMQKYLMSKPAKEVYMRPELKLTSAEAAKINKVDNVSSDSVFDPF